MVRIEEIAGIKVILNNIEDDKSFTFSTTFKTGSVNERENEKGISHLLEHMMFTGTNKRDSFQISEEMDFYGATYNAYTSKSRTVYYFSSLSSKQRETSDIFFDMLTNPIFPEDQLKKEKEIVTEEIKMAQDDIKSVVYDMMCEELLNGNIKYNILGTEESVNSFSREMLLDYYGRRYAKDNLVIAVSGKFDEELLKNQIEEYFSKLSETSIKEDFGKNEVNNKEKFVKKDINQVNIYMLKQHDDENKGIKEVYTDYILETILGEGFSSRLFKEIREKRALAYSVYAFSMENNDFTGLGIYIGTSKNKYDEAITVTKEILEEIKLNGVTETEIEKAKNSILSLRAMGKENSRLISRYMFSYIKWNKIYTEEEIEEVLKQITLEDVNKLATKLLSDFSVYVVGDINGE